MAEKPQKQTENSPAAKRTWAVWLATGLGLGYGPVMPGTYGSALGVLVYLGLDFLLSPLPYGRIYLWLAILAISILSIPIVTAALPHFRAKDPQQIVLDEVAGQMLTLAPLSLFVLRSPSYWIAIFIGFLLFRLFDAAKPYPVWKLERLPGAWGIVCDDIGAGILGALVLWGIIHIGWLG